MLDVINLQAGYGGARVLNGLSLKVAPGGAAALLGRNGAGKSTTMKTVMGLIRPSAGKIVLDGEDITALAPDAVARKGIGYVPEDRRVFESLSVRENLMTGARPGPGGGWTEARVFELFPEIARRRDSDAGTLSGGERQMLAIGRALMGNPRLILMDEPSEGLAPVVVNRLAAAINDIRADGVGLLIAEQNRWLAAKSAGSAYVIEQGAIVHEGPMAALMADDALVRAYFGV